MGNISSVFSPQPVKENYEKRSKTIFPADGSHNASPVFLQLTVSAPGFHVTRRFDMRQRLTMLRKSFSLPFFSEVSAANISISGDRSKGKVRPRNGP
jgi:hypothetical protein